MYDVNLALALQQLLNLRGALHLAHAKLDANEASGSRSGELMIIKDARVALNECRLSFPVLETANADTAEELRYELARVTNLARNFGYRINNARIQDDIHAKARRLELALALIVEVKEAAQDAEEAGRASYEAGLDEHDQ